MASPAIDSNIKIPLVLYTADKAAALKTQPKFSLHSVKAGESLFGIATDHAIPYQLLLEINLSYNLETLTANNPELVDRLAMMNGEDIFKLPITLKAGQTILIPETWRNKTKSHPDTVYALDPNKSPIDTYSSAKTGGENLAGLLEGLKMENNTQDSLARGIAQHIPVTRGKLLARATIHSAASEARHLLQCDISVVSCLAAHSGINTAEVEQLKCLNLKGSSPDEDGDEWYTPTEYDSLVRGCIHSYPTSE